ncbi:MAG: hypothetical protein QW035_04210 [Candidatus Anstonellales archaeon]
MMAKAQVSTEFMLYAAIFILIATVGLVSLLSIQQAENTHYKNLLLYEAGASMANAFEVAYAGGPGFNYTYFFSPTDFQGVNVTYSNKMLGVSLFQGDVAVAGFIYPLVNVTFSPNYCEIDTSKGVLKFSHSQNGTIYITEGCK